MKQFYVYFHCKPDGTIFYVGKGHGNRAYELGVRRRSIYHQRIVLKYGKENIKIEIQPCADEQEALDLEMLCIQSLREDSVALCNFTDGGEGVVGFKHTEASKEKNRQAHIGLPIWNKGKFLTEEHKAKLKEKRAEQIIVHSEETKEKISKAHKGKPNGRLGKKHSKVTIAKMIEKALARKPMSDKTKEKISKTLQGHIPWNKGKKGVQVAWNKGLKNKVVKK